MDISRLLQRPIETGPAYVVHVISWLHGVAKAQNSGQLLDPYTPSHLDDDDAQSELYPPVYDDALSEASSYTSFHPEHIQSWSSRDRISFPLAVNVPYHSQPQWLPPPDYTQTMAPAGVWPIPHPYLVDSKYAPLPLLNGFGFMSDPSHVPQALPYEPSPFYSHAGTDKLQLTLRQHHVQSTRHQWAASHPSVANGRAHRTQAAHMTERRRRSFQSTPYFKMTVPYLAS